MALDLSGLPESERTALGHLVAAGRLMDEIFLRQVSPDNPAMRDELAAAGGPAYEYFLINFGPWDRLPSASGHESEAFIGDTERPAGAGYYPADITAEEFNAYVEAHPDQADALKNLFTLVRRDGDALKAIPYSEAYAEHLEPAAAHLRAAAAATTNASLKKFLESRAAAFMSDDYFQSDMDWMDLESQVEVTIGPYEVYEDKLFAYKAAFEAFVTVDIPEESAELARFKSLLPWLERNLPIDDKYKNMNRGTDSPIRVVDVVFAGGDTKSGVQTIAFNLPNDEKVREAKGSKKVLLRNHINAKYEQLLVPIAQRTLTAEDAARVDAGQFLSQVLHHELSHGLGPGKLVLDGRETEVRLELKELYSTLEEAKADVMGIYNTLALVEKGDMPQSVMEHLEPTFVAGLFRSARFGVHEAHGQGTVAQFNYLLEKGALVVDADGKFGIVSEKFPGAMRDLLHEMLMLQANGDYDGTKAFLDKYGKASAELIAAIDRLSDLPVDIRPIYVTADAMETPAL
ncbi:hypothetical protein ABI59_00730 [Acidobacteria bacterium Mor1]|nr:hypothetical protein ABI59_00730 [Acidobacteria bacterium Mor1]